MNTKQYPENYPPQPPYYEEDEIDLIELWNTLWKGKWFIIGFTFICTIIAYALQVTPIYKAEVLLVPVTEESGNNGLNALAAKYGGITLLANITDCVAYLSDYKEKY